MARLVACLQARSDRANTRTDSEVVMERDPKHRVIRRYVGHLAARLAKLPLGRVADPRIGKIKWAMRTLLTAVMVGLAAGCKGLGEVEELTDWLASGARHYLGLRARTPDTTLRDLLVQLDPDEVRKLNFQFIRGARRRKQLEHDMPVRALSMDGKATSTWLFDPPDAPVQYAQRQGGNAVVRTITSCLVTVPGRPCLDAFPVPPHTNEMGIFQTALDALLSAYGHSLFDLVMYDSGANSAANASAVVERGLDYLFCLKENQPELLAEVKRVLGSLPLETPTATTTDLDGGDVATWWIWTTNELAGWYAWPHLNTAIRIHKVVTDKDGRILSSEDRYYVTSLRSDRLKASQWLELIRRRWSVENQNHMVWDKLLSEDNRPFILRPSGMVVVLLLRRLVYNLLTLFRSVTLRSERNRSQSWTRLLRDIYRSLLRATPEVMAGVRRREAAAV
jgi:hypothetical protein